MTNVACSAFSASPKLPPLSPSDCTRLQHRGQEAAGIVAFDGKQFSVERHVGLIGDTFTKRSVMDRLPGDRAIGHTRYSTTGGEGLRNVQPFFAEFAGGGFAIAHNGNITNALTVQRELQKRGSIFSSTSDTETILHLIASARKPGSCRNSSMRSRGSRAPIRWSACRRRR
jgi:glutamine phosphoribosylpyrophosphate amidotransferase